MNVHRRPAVPGEHCGQDTTETSSASQAVFLTNTLAKLRASSQVASHSAGVPGRQMSDSC